MKLNDQVFERDFLDFVSLRLLPPLRGKAGMGGNLWRSQPLGETGPKMKSRDREGVVTAIFPSLKILAMASFLSLVACSSSPHKSGVLPEERPSMAAIYNGQFAGDPGLTQARASVPKNTQKETENVSTKSPLDTQNNIPDLGPRMLPNPTIKIYVYPHFDQRDQNYIPGHLAYTKLYEETHFALPGENGE